MAEEITLTTPRREGGMMVVCPICGDSWEVPAEAYPEDGQAICEVCDGDEIITEIGEIGEFDWDEIDDWPMSDENYEDDEMTDGEE